MFCYQCQEASKGTGCNVKGVCGKTDDLALLQDLLVYQVKGIAQLTLRLEHLGEASPEADAFIIEALFATITNANFDEQHFIKVIQSAFELQEKLRSAIIASKGDLNDLHDAAQFKTDDLKSKAQTIGVI